MLSCNIFFTEFLFWKNKVNDRTKKMSSFEFGNFGGPAEYLLAIVDRFMSILNLSANFGFEKR